MTQKFTRESSAIKADQQIHVPGHISACYITDNLCSDNQEDQELFCQVLDSYGFTLFLFISTVKVQHLHLIDMHTNSIDATESTMFTKAVSIFRCKSNLTS